MSHPTAVCYIALTDILTIREFHAIIAWSIFNKFTIESQFNGMHVYNVRVNNLHVNYNLPVNNLRVNNLHLWAYNLHVNESNVNNVHVNNLHVNSLHVLITCFPIRVRFWPIASFQFVSVARMDYFIVGVTNTSSATQAPTRGAYPLCGQYPYTAAGGARMTVNCAASTPPARYVIIQQPANGELALNFCELEVYSSCE